MSWYCYCGEPEGGRERGREEGGRMSGHVTGHDLHADLEAYVQYCIVLQDYIILQTQSLILHNTLLIV